MLSEKILDPEGYCPIGQVSPVLEEQSHRTKNSAVEPFKKMLPAKNELGPSKQGHASQQYRSGFDATHNPLRCHGLGSVCIFMFSLPGSTQSQTICVALSRLK
jgi:hypothetical protein